MKRVFQCGAIVFRQSDLGAQVLLVRAKKSPQDWIFPKGHVEGDESPEDTALREAYEESGIQGVVIGAVDRPVEFTSGKEPVSVQYYLVYARSHRPSPEGREIQWSSLAEAKQKLTHRDAQRLLESAEPEIAWWASARKPLSEGDPFTQLILAEFAHAGESLLSNEESGEKRVSFFLTFAGAVGAAVAFLVGKDGPLKDYAHPVLFVMLSILLLLGYVTFLRVVVRNAASDEYKRRLSRLRQYFLESIDDARRGFLPFPPFRYAWRRPTSWGRFGRGGWFETMAAVNALLGAVLGVDIADWLGKKWLVQFPVLHTFVVPLLMGLAGACVVWYALTSKGNNVYRERMCEQHLPTGYEP